MFRPRYIIFFALSILAIIVSIGACDDGGVAQPCTNIPAGGCPLSHGVACADLACEAIYACRANNVWELQQRCSASRDGAAPTAGDGASTDGDSSSPPPFDAAIDAPPGAWGGPGCESLQAPDCALGLALSCGQGCCGCEDLFICEQGGWTLWGTCADGGPSQGR